MSQTITRGLVTRNSNLVLENIRLPVLKDTQVLVRNEAVAQNPTDVQCLDSDAFGDGAVLGCDFCGLVEAVGKDVTEVKIGDRVAGLIWGGEILGLGAFCNHSIAEESICFKVPKTVSSIEAATIPLALTTAWLALLSSDCLAIKRNEAADGDLLVLGGSSSVGQYAIQIAKTLSISVITTCSAKKFSLCKSLGADRVFDYHSSDYVEKIKEAAPNISYVFDCIGSENSSTEGANAVRSEGGTLCTVRPGKAFTENVTRRVKVTDVLVWTAFLKDHKYKEFTWPASEEDHTLAKELFKRIPQCLIHGRLRPNIPKVVAGGLQGIEEGFRLHRNGEISGFKLMYSLIP